MSQRNKLQSIAHNLSSWCLSRNFDYNGYWLTGQLYRLTKFKKRKEIVFRLIQETSAPTNEGMSTVLKQKTQDKLQSFLKEQVNKTRVLEDWMTEVKITFSFENDSIDQNHSYGQSKAGKPFIITVEIISDSEKIFTHATGGYAWKHNKLRESCRFEY